MGRVRSCEDPLVFGELRARSHGLKMSHQNGSISRCVPIGCLRRRCATWRNAPACAAPTTPIIAVDEGREGVRPPGLAAPRPPVLPFLGERAVHALDLAVLPKAVGPGAEVADPSETSRPLNSPLRQPGPLSVMARSTRTSSPAKKRSRRAMNAAHVPFRSSARARRRRQ